MKTKLYTILVNRKFGISQRYHRFHDGSQGVKKVLSWMYLLWLNFAYCVLRIRSIGELSGAAVYEEKKLLCGQSESLLAQAQFGTVENFVERLFSYDAVAFDIFDTLIFRPFSEPTDLFYFVGEQLGIMNFKGIRRQMEQRAREICYKENGHYEVTLAEIWEQMESYAGIPVKTGMAVEIATEKQFCYANPFMLEVFQELRRRKKKIIIVSDMYLPAEVLEEILRANGYSGYDKLYVSCEYGKNKAGGKLFELVKQENSGRLVHVGDNEHSDVAMAKKAGIATMHYPNVNKNALLYRPYDMSPIVGGAYRGIVNNKLYCGAEVYSQEKEYGFIYGGLFVTGYCAFIHEYCKAHQVDKLLFLSRDGDILKQAYEILFPEETTEYAYWSRHAATKLMAAEDKYDYFRRFLYHKVNQDISLDKIFSAMELSDLVAELPKELSGSSVLTDKNVEEVRVFLEANWSRVLNAYEEEHRAAKAYYENLLSGSNKAVAVDIGWAGSGAIALNHLVQKVWKLPCEIIGLVAGTNTVHNAEPDASETFLQSGKLVAYLYSQSFNRDLMKRHNPNRNYNVYWELLLSSPTPGFRGFRPGEGEQPWGLEFGGYDANVEGIRHIQDGVLAFVKEYKRHFGDVPYMFNISGRDAYAPMLVAASKNEKYLKEIEKRFALEINVG